MEWQPIETAPKDGTQFLALVSNGWYDLARFRGDLDWQFQWWTSSSGQSYPVVETHPKNTDWKESYTLTLTHWMPLPAPPEK